MVENGDIEKLLGQSKDAYARYLENGEGDALAEAGELLWECLKAEIVEAANTKIANFNALKTEADLRGETYSQLFFRCHHFHSWYFEGGVPNNFAAEKKLYIETAKTLRKILKIKLIRKAKKTHHRKRSLTQTPLQLS